jgi:EAL domain-containing protein (putative c-di-GMP-specific phosphodiesterase class I)
VRWQHPERGLLPPDTFVPIAEHTALIAPLTDWVLEAACRQAAAWRAAGMPLAVAVNVSPRSLLNGDLPALVDRVLTSTGLPAGLLELEITETAMVVDPVRAREVLLRLRAMGVSVSLDDFGTGFTSMIMLQTLPVTALKIDRAFVTGMLAGRDDSAVAESLIALAGRLGLVVVAEGVENAHVVSRLRALGCDQAQGFHLARPMPAVEVPACVLARTTVMA